MKKSTLTPFLMLAIATVLLVSCDSEKVLPQSEIPSEITQYVNTHFPNHNLLQVVEDKDGLRTSYEATLSDNITLDFNGNKEVTHIDGHAKLPDSVIPTEIAQYVATNYPNNAITDWELEDRHQEVELDNGLELEFNLNGEFIRIDN